MFTIERLAKLDAIATAVFTALRCGLDWLGEKYEDFLVNATYRVVEAKARAVDKVEDKISALKDAHIELEAGVEEAKARMKAEYHLAVGVLEEERFAKDDALAADWAEAQRQLSAAGMDYYATIEAALDKLDVEVKA